MKLPVCFFVLFSLNYQAFSQDKYDGIFFTGIGLGPAVANNVCGVCSNRKPETGYVVNVEIGYRPAQKWAFGVGNYSWSGLSKANSISNLRMSFLALFQFYPGRNIKLSAGAGYGNYFFTPRYPVQTLNGVKTLGSVIGNGFSGSAAIQYDHVIKQFHFIPGIMLMGTSLSKLKASDIYTVEQKKYSAVLSINLGVSYTFALKKVS